MWRILQYETPDDFVIATGESHTVREFVEAAFGRLGIGLDWVGEGVDERALDQSSGGEVVRIDPRYFRPAEVDVLEGDASKARSLLGWEPTVMFEDLVTMMVDADLEEQRRELYLRDGGFPVKDYHE
jgi:GDPmannose 4,6-dehydratase